MIHCKKIIRSAAAGALTLALATSFASAAFGTGVVTEGPLRMRASASTDSDVLARVAEGAQVEVLEDAQNGWYKVSYKGETGYMSRDYLSITPEKAEALPEPATPLAAMAAVEETAPQAEWALVDTSALNVRASTSTESEKVGKLYGGSVVSALSQAGEWTLVEYGSVKGYVSTEYLVFGTYDELKAAASTAGQRVVDIAKQYLGVRYRYGGASPSGFDCSGFVYYVSKQAGYSVPRTGTAMWNEGYAKVERADLQPGDIVFFTGTGGSGYISHVGIYVGGGKFIHSSSPTSGGVIYTSLSERYYATRYVGARRAFT